MLVLSNRSFFCTIDQLESVAITFNVDHLFSLIQSTFFIFSHMAYIVDAMRATTGINMSTIIILTIKSNIFLIRLDSELAHLLVGFMVTAIVVVACFYVLVRTTGAATEHQAFIQCFHKLTQFLVLYLEPVKLVTQLAVHRVVVVTGSKAVVQVFRMHLDNLDSKLSNLNTSVF